ncbi:uncharacterized protein PSFLO_05824 [Pseudozyma flocculosa]|uniref:BTB domain-containing protein n=1 Tax=Pseudozyma flocculosa TaxID=84751 RepID=A0A5C3F7H0_9BASI|nr:uncharacterized protein PSFLO_05824 [Pseudozyma flocculosa]
MSAQTTAYPLTVYLDRNSTPIRQWPPFLLRGHGGWKYLDTLIFGISTDELCTCDAVDDGHDESMSDSSDPSGDPTAAPGSSDRAGALRAWNRPERVNTPEELRAMLGQTHYLAGKGTHCDVKICLRTGTVSLRFDGSDRGLARKDLAASKAHITLSMSFVSEGQFHTFSVRSDVEQVFRSSPALRWKVDQICSSLQRLLQEASDGEVAHLCVSGHTSEPVAPALLGMHPEPAQEDALVDVAAMMVCSDESNLVKLRPARDNDVGRTVLADKAILMARSPFFKTMFESGMNETRQATAAPRGGPDGGRSMHDDGGSGSAQLSDAATGAAASSSIPVVDLHDVDVPTLQAFIVFLYAGTCKFWSQRDRPIPVETAQVYAGGPPLSLSPWSKHTLPLANAEKVYRIADMYGEPALKELARYHISNEIELDDAFRGLFTNELANLYEEILQVYIDVCVEYFDEIVMTSGYHDMMGELIAGMHPPAAAETLKMLLARVAMGKEVSV